MRFAGKQPMEEYFKRGSDLGSVLATSSFWPSIRGSRSLRLKTLGAEFTLSLCPRGRFDRESITDQEYSEFYKYLLDGSTWKDAPTLSREKARAFCLRMVRERGTRAANGSKLANIIFDPEGSTLPPERRATGSADRTKARARGQLLLAMIVDGKSTETLYPLRPDPMPDQMTRNLVESDWEEIALLDVTITLKNRPK